MNHINLLNIKNIYIDASQLRHKLKLSHLYKCIYTQLDFILLAFIYTDIDFKRMMVRINQLVCLIIISLN